MIERSQQITDTGVWIRQMDLSAYATDAGKKGSSPKTIAENLTACGFEKDKDPVGRVLWLVPTEWLNELAGVVAWHDDFLDASGKLDSDLIRRTRGGILSANAEITPEDAEMYRRKCEALSARLDDMSNACSTQVAKIDQYEGELTKLKKQVADLIAERDAERAKSAEVQRLYDQQKELLSASINNAHPELADDVASLMAWGRQTKPKIDEWSTVFPDLLKRLQTLEQEVLPSDAEEDADLHDEPIGKTWTTPTTMVKPGIASRLSRALRFG